MYSTLNGFTGTPTPPAAARAAYGGQELLGGLGRGVGGEEEREEGGAANLSEPLRKTTFKERDARE